MMGGRRVETSADFAAASRPLNMVAKGGIEPSTQGFQIACLLAGHF
jgi:hypothetical protein